MSFPELDQWDPMAEHFASEFNSHISHPMFNPSCSSSGEPFLYITNIPYDLEQEKLFQIFNTYGNVLKINVKRSKSGHANNCYGFVHYSSVTDARCAYSLIDRNNILDIHVHLGKSREQQNEMREDRHSGSQNERHSQMDPPAHSANNINQNFGSHLNSRPHTNTPGRINANNMVGDFEYKYEEKPKPFILADPPMRRSLPYKENMQSNIICNPGRQDIPVKVEVSNTHDSNYNNSYPNVKSAPGSFLNSKLMSPVNNSTNHNEYATPVRNQIKYPSPLPQPSQPRICEKNGNPILPLSASYSAWSGIENGAHPILPSESSQIPVPETYSHCSNVDECCQRVCSHCHHAGAHNPSQHCCSFQSPSYNFCSSHDPNVPLPGRSYSLCSYCKHEGKFECPDCEEPYCSRLCQEKDWPHHKMICLGRHKPQLPNHHDVALSNANVVETQKNDLDRNNTSDSRRKSLTEEYKESERNFSSLNHQSVNNSHSVDSSNRKFSPANNQSQEKPNRKVSSVESKQVENCNADHKPPQTRKQSQPVKISPQKPRAFGSSNQRCNTSPRIQQKPHSVDENKGPRQNVEAGPRKSYGEAGSVRPNTRKKRLDYDPQHCTESRGTNNEKLFDNGRKGATKKGNSMNLNGGALPKKSFAAKQDSRSSNILVPDKIKASVIKPIKLQMFDKMKVNVCYMVSLCEFYVQRVTDTEMLNQIRSEMLALSQRKTTLLSPAVDDVCGALYSDNICYRAQIKKILPDGNCLIYFLDYGNTYVIKNTNLCYLTSNMGNYPALALKFQLADIKPKNGDKNWEKESFGFFSHIVEDKSLTAHIYGVLASSYSVDLVNEEGVSVSTILVKDGYAEDISSDTSMSQIKNGTSTHACSDFKVPVFLEKLKVSAKYSITPVYATIDVIWGFVDDEDTIIKFNELITALQDSTTPDNSMTVEEGDLTAAFSSADQTWYRATVIKRMKNSFRVHYTDYGNEEEVSKLRILSHEHINVRSPLLGFKVVHKEHLNKVPELVSNVFEVTIRCVQKSYFEAETIYNKQLVKLLCYVWCYEDMLPSRFTNKISQQDKAAASLKLSKRTEVEQIPSHASDNAEKIRIAEKILTEREIPSNTKTQVIVSWVKSLHEICVQKKSDEAQLSALLQDVDTLCNCTMEKAHKPIEGEIVCARYTVDGRWYRSLVLKLLPEGKVRVLFIDYGNEEEIPSQDIKELSKKILQPIYSIHVSLYNIPLTITYNDICDKLLNKSFDLQVIYSEVIPKQVILFEDGKQVFENGSPAKTTSICSSLRPSKSNKQPISYPTRKKDAFETRISDFDGAVVRIEYIDTAKVFHVRLISQDDLFASMQRELFEFCQKHSTTPYFPEVNDVVCVCWEDSWNRGYVTEVRGDTCMIKFIDQGPTLEIVVIDIRPLAPKFFHPVFMISVYLDSVPENKLTNKVCESLKSCFYSLKLLEKTGQPLKCKMYLEELCINEGLMEKNTEKIASAPAVKPEHPKLPNFSALKKQSLPSNEILDVIFWFQENDLYFLHKASDYKGCLELETFLQQHCQDFNPLDELPQIGDIICAKCSDGLWYRACIEEVILAENKCKVLFVDYGNSEYVAKDDLHTCPPDLICIPILCICVKIANAKDYPVVLNSLVTIKTSETVENPAVVSIYVAEENGPKSSQLLTPKESDCVINEEPAPVIEPVIADRFMIDNMSSIDFPGGDVSIVIYSMLGDILYAAPYNKENIEKSMSLVEEITAFCAKSDDTNYQPVLHELVLAKFRDDGSWYRAAVLDIGNMEYNLFFIDFGGNQLTKKEDIRKMTEHFFQIPIQAHTCTLGGFSYDKANTENIRAAATKELPCFVEIEAIASGKDDAIIIEIPLFNKKLQELGLIKM